MDKKYKLICGPMATISHPAFRFLLEKFGGCDEYFTEMINAGSLLNWGPFEKYYVNPSPVPEKIVWQLTGYNGQSMIEAAKQLCELPGIGLDINMGCSAPDIYKTGAGIAWMLKDINETALMVRGIRQVVKNRLSVKLRLGDDNFTDEKFYAFTDMLVSEGVELLTLHPRTKKEKLTRPVRYNYCQELCQRYKEKGIQIYLNGNVKDCASFENAVKAAPDVSGVMISRAAVEKPWIFHQLKGMESVQVDMLEMALDFIKDVEEYQPREFWKTRLQRYFSYYPVNFLFSHYGQTQFLNAINTAEGSDETVNDKLRNALKEFFEKFPDEQIKTF